MESMLVGNTHLIAGAADDIPAVLGLLKKEGIETSRNPDLYVRAYPHFGIEEAREIRERATLRPLGERRVFVLAAPDMNREAQNALLKTLEEPRADALFFLIVPAPEALLPTLRSRAHVLALDTKKKGEGAVDAKAFLAAKPEKRLDMLKVLLEKGDDDKRDIVAILAFLSSLERTIATSGTASASAQALYRARRYATDKGALLKPLLEQVALLA